MTLDHIMHQVYWHRVVYQAAWSHVSGIDGVMLLIFWGIFAVAAMVHLVSSICAALIPWPVRSRAAARYSSPSSGAD